jgi:hypothetical protein
VTCIRQSGVSEVESSSTSVNRKFSYVFFAQRKYNGHMRIQPVSLNLIY